MSNEMTQAEAYAKLEPEDRPFCDIITEMVSRVPVSHRAMMQAGLILVAAAADAVGDGIAEDAPESEVEQCVHDHIYRAGYAEGLEEGIRAGGDAMLKRIIAEVQTRDDTAQTPPEESPQLTEIKAWVDEQFDAEAA
jgi:flagellar biosynthesis/type III secretory pathway protein FliH